MNPKPKTPSSNILLSSKVNQILGENKKPQKTSAYDDKIEFTKAKLAELQINNLTNEDIAKVLEKVGNDTDAAISEIVDNVNGFEWHFSGKEQKEQKTSKDKKKGPPRTDSNSKERFTDKGNGKRSEKFTKRENDNSKAKNPRQPKGQPSTENTTQPQNNGAKETAPPEAAQTVAKPTENTEVKPKETRVKESTIPISIPSIHHVKPGASWASITSQAQPDENSAPKTESNIPPEQHKANGKPRRDYPPKQPRGNANTKNKPVPAETTSVPTTNTEAAQAAVPSSLPPTTNSHTTVLPEESSPETTATPAQSSVIPPVSTPATTVDIITNTQPTISPVTVAHPSPVPTKTTPAPSPFSGSNGFAGPSVVMSRAIGAPGNESKVKFGAPGGGAYAMRKESKPAEPTSNTPAENSFVNFPDSAANTATAFASNSGFNYTTGYDNSAASAEFQGNFTEQAQRGFRGAAKVDTNATTAAPAPATTAPATPVTPVTTPAAPATATPSQVANPVATAVPTVLPNTASPVTASNNAAATAAMPHMLTPPLFPFYNPYISAYFAPPPPGSPAHMNTAPYLNPIHPYYRSFMSPTALPTTASSGVSNVGAPNASVGVPTNSASPNTVVGASTGSNPIMAPTPNMLFGGQSAIPGLHFMGYMPTDAESYGAMSSGMGATPTSSISTDVNKAGQASAPSTNSPPPMMTNPANYPNYFTPSYYIPSTPTADFTAAANLYGTKGDSSSTPNYPTPFYAVPQQPSHYKNNYPTSAPSNQSQQSYNRGSY